MAIAGSFKIPSAGFTIRNRQLVQIGLTQNKPDEVLTRADDAATILLFNPCAIVQMDVRRGTAEQVLRMRLRELGVIDVIGPDHRSIIGLLARTVRRLRVTP